MSEIAARSFDGLAVDDQTVSAAIRPTLALDGGVEDETGLLTGTIIAHGREMQVFVPADLAARIAAEQQELADFEADVSAAEAGFVSDGVDLLDD